MAATQEMRVRNALDECWAASARPYRQVGVHHAVEGGVRERCALRRPGHVRRSFQHHPTRQLSVRGIASELSVWEAASEVVPATGPLQQHPPPRLTNEERRARRELSADVGSRADE